MNASLRLISVPCPICGQKNFTTMASGIDYEYHTSKDIFTFVECKTCKVYYLNPRPAPEELSRIYPENYEPYHFDTKKNVTYKARNLMERKKAKYLCADLPLDSAVKIMDAGCGGTSFLECLKQAGGEKWELWGNDFDETVCNRIKTAGFKAIAGRFEDLQLNDNSFDMIIMKQVIEHLDNPVTTVVKAYNLLVPGGRLVIETPNNNSWDAKLFRSGFWGGYHFPRHWTIFAPGSLAMLGKKIGFEVVKIEFMPSPAFWIQSVHHALSPGYMSWLSYFFTIRNPFVAAVACMCDVLQKLLTGKTSNMRIVFKKTALPQGEEA